MSNTELAIYGQQQPSQAMSLVSPLVDPQAARLAIQQYELLKAAIVQPGDVQKIQGREFLKKSFWRRVATCFGLSLDLVSEQRGFDERNGLYYSVIYRAVAPNGRTMIGDGYCSTSEPGRGTWPEHNVRATAHTRAKNRAISDLVGGGEVSAEEVGDEDTRPTPPTPPAARQQPPRRVEVVDTTEVYDATPVEATAHKDATTAQLDSIRMACKSLNRDMPVVTSFDHAKVLLEELRAAWREAKKAENAAKVAEAEQSGFDLRDLPAGRRAS